MIGHFFNWISWKKNSELEEPFEKRNQRRVVQQKTYIYIFFFIFQLPLMWRWDLVSSCRKWGFISVAFFLFLAWRFTSILCFYLRASIFQGVVRLHIQFSFFTSFPPFRCATYPLESMSVWKCSIHFILPEICLPRAMADRSPWKKRTVNYIIAVLNIFACVCNLDMIW